MSESYDYVVIGAGSAGCAAAGRLSENPDATVAVIEAGPPSLGRLFEIPGLFSRQLKSFFDWDFETDPEPQLEDRRKYLPRGRVVGGSSAMNTMLYVRGARADYDQWEADGATGWSYEDVLPYFIKSEDNERGANEFHGVGGPLSVMDARSVHPLLTGWVNAGEQMGIPANPDFNATEQAGIGVFQLTQRNAIRCSSARAFLDPAMGRPNFTLLHSTLVLRILFDGTRAVGVELDHLGETRTIEVSGELILSAGAYQSPHLLLLSGVGPADELQQFGIRPVLDLPDVGRNLQDHVGALLAYTTRTEHPLFGDSSTAEEELRSTGFGPMTWTEAGAFVRSQPGLEQTDLQFHAALGVSLDEGLAPATNPGISFGPYVTSPDSRGSVRLRTAEPYSKPRIQHNFLTEQSDRVKMRNGIRIALEIARQSALTEHLLDPSADAQRGLIPHGDSDAEIDQYLAGRAFAFWHPCASCAIGKVTDPELRVYGLDNLRVADASVIPREISGNTNAPCIMIGERVATFIKDEDRRAATADVNAAS
jgi:choline dehydrogenase